METKFKFNIHICTSREQSERLLALGLKPETADMSYQYLNQWDGWFIRPIEEDEKITHMEIPAWSLHRLWMSIPKYIELGKDNEYEIVMIHGCLKVVNDLGDIYKYFDDKDSIYDNVIDCIEWLIKEGYFNKEYLEE